MGLQRQFLSGMASGVGSVVIKTLLNILLIPLLIGTLGSEQYSLYVLLIGVIELFILMDFGLTPSITKILGIYRSSEQPEKAREILYMAHCLYIFLAVAALLTGAVALLYIPGLFHSTSISGTAAEIAMGIILLEGVLTLYSAYFSAILLAHCLNQWTNLGDTISSITGNAVGLLLLLNGFGLESLLIARLGATLIRSSILIVQTLKVEPEIFRIRSSFKWRTFKELLEQSFHATMLKVSVIISHKIDNFVIAFFLPLTAVGTFEIVFRFLGITIQLILKMSEGIFPMFARMMALSERDNARQFFLRVSCLNNFVMSLLLILMVSFYPELFQLFSAGQIPIKPTIPILAVAVPSIWSVALQMPATYYLFTSGRQRYLTISSLITALCNLILSLVFIQYMGLVGVALGTLIPQFIQHQGSLIRETCKELGISFKEYMNKVHLAVVLPLLSAFFMTQLLRPLTSTGLYPLIPIGFISLSVAFLSSILWFILTATPHEKNLFAVKIVEPAKKSLLQLFLKTEPSLKMLQKADPPLRK